MALKLTEAMRSRFTPPESPTTTLAAPAREPEPSVSIEVLEQMQQRSAAADVRLAKVLDAAVERMAEITGKPHRYRMKHTFKRDDKGRIVSAETIVEPMGD